MKQQPNEKFFQERRRAIPSNTGMKIWHTGIPEEIYQNRETLGITETWQVCLIEASFKKEKKFENTSKKITAHRNKNKILSTTYLMTSIFFYNSKISLLFFSLLPIKICWKPLSLDTMQSHWALFTQKDVSRLQ